MKTWDSCIKLQQISTCVASVSGGHKTKGTFYVWWECDLKCYDLKEPSWISFHEVTIDFSNMEM